MNADSVLSRLDDSSDNELDLMESDCLPMKCLTLPTLQPVTTSSQLSDNHDDDDLDILGLSDDNIISNQASPVLQPGPSQLRAMQQNYIWTTASRQPQTNVFVGTQGPTSKVNVNDVNSPYNYFNLMFDETFLENIVTETNRYTSQYLAKNLGTLSPRARARSWKPVTRNKLEVFLGLVLLTGLIDKKGHLESYWSKNSLIATPFLSKL